MLRSVSVLGVLLPIILVAPRAFRISAQSASSKSKDHRCPVLASFARAGKPPTAGPNQRGIIRNPISVPELLEPPPFFAKPKRLLDVSDVAEWLGVSKGWVRDHALGRRQPRLFAIKLGPAKGKGLWKFREEDVHQFIQEQRRK